MYPLNGTFNCPSYLYVTCGQKSTPCYIVRPWEKNFFVGWMLTMSLISLFLLLVDIVYLTQHHGKKHIAKRKINNIVNNSDTYLDMTKSNQSAPSITTIQAPLLKTDSAKPLTYRQRNQTKRNSKIVKNSRSDSGLSS
jgi:hypothetical protein